MTPIRKMKKMTIPILLWHRHTSKIKLPQKACNTYSKLNSIRFGEIEHYKIVSYKKDELLPFVDVWWYKVSLFLQHSPGKPGLCSVLYSFTRVYTGYSRWNVLTFKCVSTSHLQALWRWDETMTHISPQEFLYEMWLLNGFIVCKQLSN